MAAKGKKVLLTGGSGFVASQILAHLIEEGYQTTVTVRSESKARKILELHPSWEPHISFAFVADIAKDKAFDNVFMEEKTGFDYIIHTASPVNFSITDFQKDLIDPAIKGTTGVIEAAHRLGGTSLDRLILLGSAVAVLNSFQDERVAGDDYTESDWNPVTASQAIESKSPVLGYNASKTLSELAAWELMKEMNPTFDLTVINPDIIIGPMLQPVASPRHVNETNVFAIYNFLNGTYKDIEEVRFPFYHFVDVRDVARGVISSLNTPKASNQRIILVSGVITPQLVADIIHKHFRQLHTRVAVGVPGRVFPPGLQPTGWDTSKSFDIFGQGWSYRSLETSVIDTVQSLLRLEEKGLDEASRTGNQT